MMVLILQSWRVIGFPSFEDFCREKLGKTLDEVSAIVAGVKTLQGQGVPRPTLAEAMTAQQLALDDSVGPIQSHGGARRTVQDIAADPAPLLPGKQIVENGNQGSDATLKNRDRGAEYLIRRLKRDAQDEDAPNHQQAAEALVGLQRGEIPSARQAAIRAGIVRVPTLLELAKRAVRKMDKKERSRLAAWLGLFGPLLRFIASRS